MTCIVAIKDKGKVYIGGDSAGVSGYDITLRADAKVFKKGDFIFGFTSSFRMGQLLRYNLNVPKQKKSMSDEEFMSTVFIDAVRGCLKTGGYTKIESNQEEGGSFLVGYSGDIYKIASDFQCGIHIDNYSSVGCGSEYAKGSLFSTKEEKLTPEERIIKSLEAAEYFSTGVSAPFKMVILDKKVDGETNE